MESYRPSREEIQYFVVASLVVGAAFTAYKGKTSLEAGLVWTGIAALVLLTREFGQRTVAEWMDAYVDLELSMEGSFVTVFGAITAYLTQLPVLLLFPVASSFSGRRYEHWGRTIDAIWMKRQFWIDFGGVVAMFLSWVFALLLGSQAVAEAYILFLFFQLMPFDYHAIPTGTLDGAYVLRWSGFLWLVSMGVTVAGIVFTL